MTTLTTVSTLRSAVIEAMLHELQNEELTCVGDAENIIEDVEVSSLGEVVYNHDALAILDNSDFEPASDLDFSGCDSAMQCVMQEAQSMVDNTIYSIRDGVTSDLKDLLDELFSVDSVTGYTVETVEVIRGGSVLDNVTHDREEDMSCGSEVVSACFYLAHNAVTVSFEGMTLRANLVKDNDNEDSDETESE